ncbi:hypothetical protein BJX99DRAFT_255316 [Aspergillus californicus]
MACFDKIPLAVYIFVIETDTPHCTEWAVALIPVNCEKGSQLKVHRIKSTAEGYSMDTNYTTVGEHIIEGNWSFGLKTCRVPKLIDNEVYDHHDVSEALDFAVLGQDDWRWVEAWMMELQSHGLADQKRVDTVLRDIVAGPFEPGVVANLVNAMSTEMDPRE